jgi:lipoate-protein ligase A
MLDIWRLLKLETHDAYVNMAIDEAVLTARMGKLVPDTVRFYGWKPSAVSIGKFQSIQNEVQLENCRKHGVDIVRRVTGGGTVYHDSEDEITYSVIANKQDLSARDITTVYARIYAGIVEALTIMGITADFSEGNQKTCPNLTINGRKISGSAQCHKSGIVLQHGTLLLNVDLGKMFSLIRIPWAKTCIDAVSVAKNKITSVSMELGRSVSTEEVNCALIEGFQKALNIKLVEGQLAPFENELAQKLCREKYSSDRWNFHGEGSQ